MNTQKFLFFLIFYIHSFFCFGINKDSTVSGYKVTIGYQMGLYFEQSLNLFPDNYGLSQSVFSSAKLFNRIQAGLYLNRKIQLYSEFLLSSYSANESIYKEEVSTNLKRPTSDPIGINASTITCFGTGLSIGNPKAKNALNGSFGTGIMSMSESSLTEKSVFVYKTSNEKFIYYKFGLGWMHNTADGFSFQLGGSLLLATFPETLYKLQNRNIRTFYFGIILAKNW